MSDLEHSSRRLTLRQRRWWASLHMRLDALEAGLANDTRRGFIVAIIPDDRGGIAGVTKHYCDKASGTC